MEEKEMMCPECNARMALEDDRYVCTKCGHLMEADFDSWIEESDRALAREILSRPVKRTNPIKRMFANVDSDTFFPAGTASPGFRGALTVCAFLVITLLIIFGILSAGKKKAGGINIVSNGVASAEEEADEEELDKNDYVTLDEIKGNGDLVSQLFSSAQSMVRKDNMGAVYSEDGTEEMIPTGNIELDDVFYAYDSGRQFIYMIYSVEYDVGGEKVNFYEGISSGDFYKSLTGEVNTQGSVSHTTVGTYGPKYCYESGNEALNAIISAGATTEAIDLN